MIDGPSILESVHDMDGIYNVYNYQLSIYVDMWWLLYVYTIK